MKRPGLTPSGRPPGHAYIPPPGRPPIYQFNGRFLAISLVVVVALAGGVFALHRSQHYQLRHALRERAEQQLADGDHAIAVQLLRQHQLLSPDDLDSRLELNTLQWSRAEKPEELLRALESSEALLRDHPELTDVRLHLAEKLLIYGRSVDALKHFTVLGESGTDAAVLDVWEGLAHETSGNDQEAEQAYLRAVDSRDDFTAVQLGDASLSRFDVIDRLANLYVHKLDDHDLASELVIRNIARFPDSTELRSLQVRLRLAMSSNDRATAAQVSRRLNTQEGEDGGFARYTNVMVDLLEQSLSPKTIRAARATLDDLLRRRPEVALFSLAKAFINERTGHLREATENYLQAVERGARESHMLRRLTDLLTSQDRYAEIETLSSAIARTAAHHPAPYRRALTEAGLMTAEAILTELQADQPLATAEIMILAVAYGVLKRDVEAARQWASLLLRPDVTPAMLKRYIGRELRHLRPDLVDKPLDRLQQAGETGADILELAAWRLCVLGRPQAVLPVIERFLRNETTEKTSQVERAVAAAGVLLRLTDRFSRTPATSDPLASRGEELYRLVLSERRGTAAEFSSASVPEPGSITLFGIGVAVVAIGGWRRCRKQAVSNH